MKTFSPRHLLTASALAVTVGLGYAAAQDAQPDISPEASQQAQEAANNNEPLSAPDTGSSQVMPDSFADLVQQVAPAVVNITTTPPRLGTFEASSETELVSRYRDGDDGFGFRTQGTVNLPIGKTSALRVNAIYGDPGTKGKAANCRRRYLCMPLECLNPSDTSYSGYRYPLGYPLPCDVERNHMVIKEID